MSFTNIECKTINFNTIAGIAQPVSLDYYGTAVHNIEAPYTYLFISNVSGGPTGTLVLNLPSILETNIGSYITIIIEDASTIDGSGNKLTIADLDSTPIYGNNIFNINLPLVMQIYNCGHSWVCI